MKDNMMHMIKDVDFQVRYIVEAFVNGEWKQVSTGNFAVLEDAKSVVKLYYKKKYKKVQITEVWI